MFTSELDKLLVLHVGDLDEGVRRFEALQLKISAAVDKVIQEWAESNGWVSSKGKWEDGEAFVCPPDWVDADGTELAWFALDYGSGDLDDWKSGNDYFWVTRLCAEGAGQLGMRFGQDEFRKTAWKKFLQRNGSKLADTRFIFDDEPSFFLPVKVEKQTLADGAEEENFEAAMAPFVEAFDYIKSIVARFDELRDLMAAET
ncbi:MULTISPECIES: hypothetical protein [unclassified Rhizobium]|uniref:hypothetical protein n=1 Tax=unclassified Rhizobium TaxID=2613769 RepID=UPI001AD9AA63|nr:MULTISPECIES: hypothetical protein [unclassified Rhizobium]MBO9127947.1 hypothetical protein [Rhizobium sp. 16-488-2b]MBO9178524.1 hypothetical protein [Rhizobium sp. 16-488-2a]